MGSRAVRPGNQVTRITGCLSPKAGPRCGRPLRPGPGSSSTGTLAVSVCLAACGQFLPPAEYEAEEAYRYGHTVGEDVDEDVVVLELGLRIWVRS